MHFKLAFRALKPRKNPQRTLRELAEMAGFSQVHNSADVHNYFYEFKAEKSYEQGHNLLLICDNSVWDTSFEEWLLGETHGAEDEASVYEMRVEDALKHFGTLDVYQNGGSLLSLPNPGAHDTYVPLPCEEECYDSFTSRCRTLTIPQEVTEMLYLNEKAGYADASRTLRVLGNGILSDRDLENVRGELLFPQAFVSLRNDVADYSYLLPHKDLMQVKKTIENQVVAEYFPTDREDLMRGYGLMP